MRFQIPRWLYLAALGIVAALVVRKFTAIKLKGSVNQMYDHGKPSPTRRLVREDGTGTHVTESILDLADLLPDDKTRLQSFQPLPADGHQRLYHFSLKTRIYQQYLDLWDRLHLVPCEDRNPYFQDNIHKQIRALGLPTAELQKLTSSYDDLRYFVIQLGQFLYPWTSPFFAEHISMRSHFHERGIVFTASDEYILPLVVAIRNLRALNCSLPIEVMYFGEEDMSSASREILLDLPNVTSRDLSLMISNKDFVLGGWDLKPFALLFSSFQEVILMDADAYMLRDPACLFHEPEYLSTGTLFFLDRRIRPKEAERIEIHRIIPGQLSSVATNNRILIKQSSQMQESGIVVVDKSRHLIAMLMACHLNGLERDNPALQKLHGDKETYWLAFEMIGSSSYAFHNGRVAALGCLQRSTVPNTSDTAHRLCTKQLLHLDTKDEPLWFNGGLYGFNDNPGHELGTTLCSEGYLVEEATQIDTEADWERHDLPMYWCLGSNAFKEFSEKHRAIFDSLRKSALDIGMYSKLSS